MKRILILDNYDSFTYNLVHYVKEFDKVHVDVCRNDKIRLEEIEKYDGIILSPGPGVPAEAGMLKEIIRHFHTSKPIFGVCLGQQAIAEVFGGRLINLSKVHHGVATEIRINQPPHYLFDGLHPRIQAGRYHSWAVDPEGLPSCLEVLSEDLNGEIMALCHKDYDVCGVQFHPESILTPQGKKIVFNWLDKLQTKQT
ncbi:MAG: anthranilate synthase component II [Bacteroidales bacterium]